MLAEVTIPVRQPGTTVVAADARFVGDVFAKCLSPGLRERGLAQRHPLPPVGDGRG